MPERDSLDSGEGSEPAAAPAPRPRAVGLYRSKSLLRLGLEVLLISAGVFLGLMGEQWRERAQHRELAEHALGRFRTEIQANHAAVTRVVDYHVTMKKSIDAYLAADAKTRPTITVRMEGSSRLDSSIPPGILRWRPSPLPTSIRSSASRSRASTGRRTCIPI